MTQQTFDQIKPEYKYIQDFIAKLVVKGIPLDLININDFASSYPYRVYVGVYYRSDKNKVYKRFSDREVASCVKWFRDNYAVFMNWKFA